MEKTVHLIHELDRLAFAYENEVAVFDGLNQLTYAALHSHANGIAARLHSCRASENAATGTYFTVGLFFDPCLEMPAAILGVLKSGHMYVPLDVHLPDKRISQIMDDARIQVLLTNDSHMERAALLAEERQLTVLNIADIEAISAFVHPYDFPPEQPAYLMYTSGSSGQPKGVIQTQENILFFCTAFAELMKMNVGDRIALTTSFSHTVSVLDIFGSFLSGACIVVYDVKKEPDLRSLLSAFSQHEITVFHSIPALFRRLFGDTSTAVHTGNIRLVILGGEDISKQDFEIYKAVFPDTSRMVNLYGSSEILMAFSQDLYTTTILSRERIPVGLPMKGVTFEILDEHNKPQGMLGVGELVFTSRFLSPGYWGQPQHTALMTVPGTSLRMYRSGDLGRMLPEGVVEYVGRNDMQIKLNGYRIELQEIEITINTFPGIKKAVVKAFERENENGQYRICCFYVAEEDHIDEAMLRHQVLSALPQYMLPERFIQIEEFPLTASGKINRSALDIASYDSLDKSATPLLTETERTVAAIWADILGYDSFSVTDKFFEVGGNSLTIIQLQEKLDVLYPQQLTFNQVFDHQTIAGIAALLEKTVVKQV
ncbi:non-ribosomal peptide synthetase [Chitinophaga sp. Ak27]|uniref:non-ribosomal peptide synthetase n=1 Tax=Chitinophaga sp. Ak27 TaxID=2726116 RepID=UPI00145C7DE0|nr:non-ribosomal peptide synthetase [Chitinophaga sp. Ak27]NLU93280.1 AMP-binding protein [Chitinophaga sp. Ak27]